MGCFKLLARRLAGGTLDDAFVTPMLLAHLAILIYSLSYEMSVVVTPFINKLVEGDSTTYANLKTAVAILQLIGGILFGRFKDVSTGKNAMLLAHTACFISYTLMTVARSLPIVFLSMAPTVLQHGTQAAMMIIADITAQGEARSVALGYVMLTYGIGALIGPLFAGFMAKRAGAQPTAGCGAAAELLLLFVVALFMAKTRHEKIKSSSATDDDGEASVSKRSSVCSISQYTRLLGLAGVASLICIHLSQQLSFWMLESMLLQFAEDEFRMDPGQVGILQSLDGVARIVASLSVGILISIVGERGFISGGLLLSSAALSTLLFTHTDWGLMLAQLGLCMGNSLISAVIPGLLTQLVPAEDSGTILGLDMATRSLANIVCPLVSNFVCRSYSFNAVVIVALAGMLLTLAFTFVWHACARRRVRIRVGMSSEEAFKSAS